MNRNYDRVMAMGFAMMAQQFLHLVKTAIEFNKYAYIPTTFTQWNPAPASSQDGLIVHAYGHEVYFTPYEVWAMYVHCKEFDYGHIVTDYTINDKNGKQIKRYTCTESVVRHNKFLTYFRQQVHDRIAKQIPLY
jgi:phosphoribulokinase